MVWKKSILLYLGFLIINILPAQDLSSRLTNLNHQIDETVDLRVKKKVRIGISSSNYYNGSSVSGDYIKSVVLAGGEPIIIPPLTDTNILRSIISNIDGLVLIGGVDFDPQYYNEKVIEGLVEIDSIRDISDLTLIKLATDRNVPVLGICRGEQGLNIAFGGTLFQDIPSQIESDILHNQTEKSDIGTHSIRILADSKLSSILQKDSLMVNSFHHQSVKDVAKGFRAVAFSDDGVIEAIEAYPHRNILAVQWHPEKYVGSDDSVMFKLFDNLMSDAATYKKARMLHNSILSIDSHVDTPTLFKNDGYNFSARDASLVNLPKMEEGALDAVFMAAYIRQGDRDVESSQNAVEYITNMINQIHLQATIHADLCGIATSRKDIVKLKSEGKKALLLGVENAYGIGKDISTLELYYNIGVRYITLCHTKDNDVCDTSSETQNEWGGLSPFGREVVKEMNRLGIMIDVSHVGINTFNDVLKLSTKPIIASHSSVRNLCDHDRNLTDDQIRAIAKNNGVIQVCMVDLFINSNTNQASLEDAIDHVDYIVSLVGIDHVGIGSDFDGGGHLLGLEGANDLINITIKLLERGYSEGDIAKIWGDNLLRVLEAQ